MAFDKTKRLLYAITSICLLMISLLFFKANIVAAYTDLSKDEYEKLSGFARPENVENICEHKNYEIKLLTESACEKEGVEVATCLDCNSFVAGKSIPAKEHMYEFLHVGSTCNQEGFEYDRCVECNNKENIVMLPMLEHTIETITISESTCSKTGKVQDKCTKCNTVVREETTAKLEHKYEQTDYKAPLPNNNGYKITKCKYCGDKITTTLVFEPKASNSVYMPTAGIHAKFVVGPCNQEYTDRYDITVSYDFINSTNPVMFGHNTRSLGPMYKVKVGDYIYLTENGKTTTYKVTHSEVGVDINYSTNIQGVNTGVLCIGNSSTKTLRIFTCYNSAKYGKCRWIILAQPI